eukprot:s826_g24.t1
MPLLLATTVVPVLLVEATVAPMFVDGVVLLMLLSFATMTVAPMFVEPVVHLMPLLLATTVVPVLLVEGTVAPVVPLLLVEVMVAPMFVEGVVHLMPLLLATMMVPVLLVEVTVAPVVPLLPLLFAIVMGSLLLVEVVVAPMLVEVVMPLIVIEVMVVPLVVEVVVLKWMLLVAVGGKKVPAKGRHRFRLGEKNEYRISTNDVLGVQPNLPDFGDQIGSDSSCPYVGVLPKMGIPRMRRPATEFTNSAGTGTSAPECQGESVAGQSLRPSGEMHFMQPSGFKRFALRSILQAKRCQ